MIDHFATLGQPRRPWLDAEPLKETFHRLSATLHPDVPGTGDAARFAAVNTAFSVLKEPASRLRHLLELTDATGLSKVAAPAGELGGLFMRLAGIRRRLDDLLAKRSAASSPLTRALRSGDESTLRRELEIVRDALETTESAAFAEVREIDANWPAPEQSERLAGLCHRLSYLKRWRDQVGEALFTLSLPG